MGVYVEHPAHDQHLLLLSSITINKTLGVRTDLRTHQLKADYPTINIS